MSDILGLKVTKTHPSIGHLDWISFLRFEKQENNLTISISIYY